ncbi:hypothetical protein [Fastidiosipila sanguinis]|uniref:Alpha-ribazole-5-phosphate synthase n=1 Tax=Fastidiosipila sanguinis TaxID=236753 RepID=A0A2S0KN05_9FIRM|nr:hypothetical protein [Fastidiosipila sanguinis]AVM42394.1 hypothetical protein C5Q98_03755 [Fastidiosipila sanguinis]
MQNTKRYRDLTVMDLGEKSLVFSCDTSSSSGEKPSDYLNVSPELTARYCLRVALLELLAVNTNPTMTFNLIGNEINPTGQAMLEGIQSELDLAGYPEILQNGSTEENMPTSMTSVSVLLVGEVLNKEILIQRAEADNLVIQIGRRSVGPEVLEFEDKMIQYEDVKQLRDISAVREIVPVGSRGILYEAETLAECNNLKFELEENLIGNSDLIKSAGPATTVLVAVEKSIADTLLERFKEKEARVIGRLV